MWARADARFALGYWPWSLLAQPDPLPERLLAAAPDALLDAALGGWGSPAAIFPPEVRSAYLETLQDAERAHAICEEYRAAAGLDRTHDQVDVAGRRRMACPVLALWGAQGSLDTWYPEAGGPLAIWRAWAENVQGHAIEAGHFFPEEAPDETAEALTRFFSVPAPKHPNGPLLHPEPP